MGVFAVEPKEFMECSYSNVYKVEMLRISDILLLMIFTVCTVIAKFVKGIESFY